MEEGRFREHMNHDFDAIASQLRGLWSIDPEVSYLNHGSFGPSPREVSAERQKWSELLERQPMDFYVRRLAGLLDEASTAVGRFVGADGKDLAFVDNATAGMNVIAHSISLDPGDEVVLTDHEYGAVRRLWEQKARAVGARVVTARLPLPVESSDSIVDAIFSVAGPRTRLLVVSHVTSPSALVLPVEAICRRAERDGIPVAVDGPHAVAMLPLEIEQLGCDYYTASCHKWLCAPFGSGFLYVRRRSQSNVRPAVVSWGVMPDQPTGDWRSELGWIGTRDPAPFLATPSAIRFLERLGLEEFRTRTHELASYARRRLLDVSGQPPICPDSSEWYGSMVAVPLPPGPAKPLQHALWDEHQIEIPVNEFAEMRLIRVSCHWYTTYGEIDRMVEAVRGLLGREGT
jgi:isopenicillin-N epimerase